MRSNRREFHDSVLKISIATLFARRLPAGARDRAPPDVTDLCKYGFVINSCRYRRQDAPPSKRKPDEILQSLAARGGYFDLYLMPYLLASPTVPTREHVLDHLLHAINVCGADHVGIASDGSIAEGPPLPSPESRQPHCAKS
jgi:hypothetical protein